MLKKVHTCSWCKMKKLDAKKTASSLKKEYICTSCRTINFEQNGHWVVLEEQIHRKSHAKKKLR